MGESGGIDSYGGRTMPKAYSADIRMRVIARVEGGASRREAAEQLDIGPSAAVKWVKCFHETGSCAAKPRRRMHLRWIDRALFVWLYRRYPRILDALSIIEPETVVRWHRKGFTGYWRWKSRSPGGRPRIAREVRDLIRRMSFENSLWGATKIHGELLKLGIAVAQSTVSIYMVPRRDRPLQ